MARIILISSSFLALCAAPNVFADDLDDFVNTQIVQKQIPGLSLAVLRGGAVFKLGSYGKSNLELGVCSTPDTVYELASVSKSFIATAILMLVEDGILALDDGIRRYLPSLPVAWNGVTIRHLLSHMSGIVEYLDVPGFSFTRDYSDQELLDLITRVPLAFKPGDEFAYTNSGYCLLAMIINARAGIPFGDFLNKRIFAPLGMTATRVNNSKAIIANRAAGYALGYYNAFLNADYVSRTELAFGDCALISSASDLAKWDVELSNPNPNVVKKSVRDQMWTRAKRNDGTEVDYGLGWGVFRQDNLTWVAHAGSIQGFQSLIVRYSELKLSVILLANIQLDDHALPDLAWDIAKRVSHTAVQKPARATMGMRKRGP